MGTDVLKISVMVIFLVQQGKVGMNPILFLQYNPAYKNLRTEQIKNLHYRLKLTFQIPIFIRTNSACNLHKMHLAVKFGKVPIIIKCNFYRVY